MSIAKHEEIINYIEAAGESSKRSRMIAIILITANINFLWLYGIL